MPLVLRSLIAVGYLSLLPLGHSVVLSAGGNSRGASAPLGSWRWLDRDLHAFVVPGPYRTYGSLLVQFREDDDFTLWEEDEVRLYWELLRKSARPRYFLIELTTYPLAALSSWTESTSGRIYHAFDLWPGFNLLRSLGAGYQEPWSMSLFLGQLATFWDLNDRDELVVEATGVAGLVLTTGLHQLFDNVIVPGPWFRAEWKIKGAGKDGDRRRSWDLTVGYRWYGSPDLANTAGITLTRQITARGLKDLGLGKNSLMALEIQVPTLGFDGCPSRVMLEYGKFYPLRNWLVGLKAGYVYENRKTYDGQKFSDEPMSVTEFFLKPLILF